MRSMRALFTVLLLLPCLALLVGCPKKKTEGAAEGGADEAGAAAETATDAAAASTPAAPSAKNVADVARFPAETKIENEAIKTLSYAVARTTPKGGAVVASLRPGLEVTKIAAYQDSFLVTFADPKEATVTLMGWLGKEAFVGIADGGVHDAAVKEGGVDAGKPPVKCAANQIAVSIGAADLVCKKKCTADTDCTGGAKGSCGLAAAGAPGGKAVHVCLNE